MDVLVRMMALLGIAVLLAGCTGHAEASRSRDTLVALARADGNTMNPLYAQGQQDAAIYVALLFDTLAATGPDFSSVPDLATSWTHSADGLHWTVTLRGGVRWSDGVPVTVRDVLFTYRLMQDPKTAYVGAGSLEAVAHVSASGPSTLRFDLKHVTAKFESDVLGTPILPQHVLGAIAPEHQLGTTFGEHPIGTGPYVLRTWQHDSNVVFERNPAYWAGPARIRRIEFRIIFNDQAEVDALEDGSADLVDYLGVQQSERLAREAPNVGVLQLPTLEVGVVEPNLRRPGLRDVIVRQAMMYAQNRQAVIDGFYHGRAEPARSWVEPALTRWYDPSVFAYPYDPARARAMLDAAGWKAGADGVRTRNGVRLAFEALVNQGSTLVLDELLAFAADEAAVGIQVRTRLLDFPSMVDRGYSGKYDLIFDVRGGSIDPDPTYLFLSTMEPPAGGNTVGFRDALTDRLIGAGVRELSYRKRRDIYRRLQRHLAGRLPMLWDVNVASQVGYAKRLHFDRRMLPFPLMWASVAHWTLAS